MTTAVSIHSHKGGSGKTLVTMNLAAYLVKQGFRVAIIDMDLSAPSLQTYAPGRTEKKINDYLLESADPKDVFFDGTYLVGDDAPGKLFVGLANTSGAAIAKINQRNQDALLNDLYLMMELVRNVLPSEPFETDFIIIDTSPGLTTHAINGVAITDHVIMVLRLVNADAGGTRQFLETLYQSVQPEASLIINQVAPHILEAGGAEKITDLVNSQIINTLPPGNVKLAGILVNDPSVITNEFNYALSKQTSEGQLPRPIHLIDPNSQSFSLKFSAIIEDIIGV
ncbi:MAG: MinD/ParA family ATP-binding protein [Candidatus Kariarchaeaceae archaeon]|jgi:MinD-like ATPase involved in chromosome partitioning or flagellar assembly